MSELEPSRSPYRMANNFPWRLVWGLATILDGAWMIVFGDWRHPRASLAWAKRWGRRNARYQLYAALERDRGKLLILPPDKPTKKRKKGKR